MDRKDKLRLLPKIDKTMELAAMKELAGIYGYEPVRNAAREVEEEIRREILDEKITDVEQRIHELPAEIRQHLENSHRRGMRRVVNGTGVILHTNLGRAPLGKELVQKLVPLMTGYTNLEMDLESGKRGSRYAHFEELLCNLTGAEAAIAVNNNAAAVLLMLTVLAAGGETVVSRGELVEIGGKFRIPDVCRQSGTVLVETGTTNRTYLEDYRNARTENTAVFLKVHTSNYQITGFTHETSVKELAELAHSLEIPLLADLGSGCLLGMEDYGLGEEPEVQKLIKDGADLVSFSGDKLLGGPQAGIIVGKRELIEKLSSHPLMRALRIDKFTAAALEETLRLYTEDRIREEIPVYAMMHRTARELEEMAKELKRALTTGWLAGEEKETAQNAGWQGELPETETPLEKCAAIGELQLQVVRTRSLAGGGTTPGKSMPGAALRIKSDRLSAREITQKLRRREVPVIGRIEDGWVCLEMRTILPGELDMVKKAIEELECV